MSQGGDRGTQYRSGIYCTTEEQKTLAEASRKAYQHALNAAGHDGAITTEIRDVPTFYYAEDDHQQYLDKPGNRQYCSAQPTGVALPKPDSWDLPDDLKAKAAKINEDVWGMLWNNCVF
jgi:peptide-methionine (S)-S-oxide reductase